MNELISQYPHRIPVPDFKNLIICRQHHIVVVLEGQAIDRKAILMILDQQWLV